MYHVRCGLTEIYAGTMNAEEDTFNKKSLVTKEAIAAVAQYEKKIMEERAEQTRIKKFRFNDGTVLKVTYKLEKPNA